MESPKASNPPTSWLSPVVPLSWTRALIGFGVAVAIHVAVLWPHKEAPTPLPLAASKGIAVSVSLVTPLGSAPDLAGEQATPQPAPVDAPRKPPAMEEKKLARPTAPLAVRPQSPTEQVAQKPALTITSDSESRPAPPIQERSAPVVLEVTPPRQTPQRPLQPLVSAVTPSDAALSERGASVESSSLGARSHDNTLSASSAEPSLQEPAILPSGALNVRLFKLANPKPIYPISSRRLGEEGVVELKAMVLEDGRVAEVTVVQSSGFARLDESALRAVRQWRYVLPSGQRMTRQWLAVPIDFNLSEPR